MFDRESAMKVDQGLQDALFIMAVSNSCVNPLVYGTYNLNLKNELSRCFGQQRAPQHLARRPTGSTALRTQASHIYNSSVSSRSTFQLKVVDNGSHSRSTRMTFSPIDHSASKSKSFVQINNEGHSRKVSRDSLKNENMKTLSMSRRFFPEGKGSRISLSLNTIDNEVESYKMIQTGISSDIPDHSLLSGDLENLNLKSSKTSFDQSNTCSSSRTDETDYLKRQNDGLIETEFSIKPSPNSSNKSENRKKSLGFENEVSYPLANDSVDFEPSTNLLNDTNNMNVPDTTKFNGSSNPKNNLSDESLSKKYYDSQSMVDLLQ